MAGAWTMRRSGTSGSVGLAFGAGGGVAISGGVVVGGGVGGIRIRWRSILLEKELTLFLGSLRIHDQLLLSLNKSNRFRKLLCSGTQGCKFR